MRYRGTGIAVVVVIMGMVSAAPAFDDKGGVGDRMAKMEDERFNEVSKDLNLTPEQQQKLLQNRQAQKTAMAAAREKMRAARLAMKEELGKDSPDRARLEELNADMKSQVGAMMDLRLEGMLATKEVLSPEQFRKLGEKMEHGREKRGEGFRERLRGLREKRSGEGAVTDKETGR